MKKLLVPIALIVALWTTQLEAEAVEINDTISDSIGKWETRSYPLTITNEGLLTVQFAAALPEKFVRYNLVHVASNTEIDSKIINEATSSIYGIKPGEYEIRLTGIGNVDSANYPYQFTTSFEKGFTYDQEPNNTIEQAQAIPPNTLIQQTAGYKDMYAIMVKKPQTIVFSSSNNARIMLYHNDEMIGDSLYMDELKVPVKAGTYYVVVQGDYAFSYNFTSNENFVELEPNATIQDAVTLLVNKTMSGIMNTALDHDTFKFNVSETGFAHFNVTHHDTTIRTRYIVYNEAGKKLFHFNEYNSFQMGLEKGTYYIKIEMSHPNVGMPYTINYTLEPNALPNIEGTTQQLPLNETLTAISPGTLGWNNTYHFTATEAGYYEFNITPQQRAQMAITITNENGTYLSNGYSAMRDHYQYRIGLNKGTYNVNVSMDDTPYTLKATQISHYAEHERNHLVALATPLTLSKETFGYVDTDTDIDYFTFTLEKDQLISWNIASKSDVPLQLRLADPASNTVVEEEKTKHIGAKLLKKGKYALKLEAPKSTEYTVTVNTVTPILKDIPATHTYYNEIMRMYALGIITGFEDHTFKPQNVMKRHHVAAMIVRSQAPALKDVTAPFAFPDVPRTHSNYMNIQKLVSSGVVDANLTGFNPDGTITRAQMAKILIKAFGLEDSVAERITFKDVKKSDWYYEYVQKLAYYGITTGSNGYFKPNEPLTRQHFAVFLSRMLQMLDQDRPL